MLYICVSQFVINTTGRTALSHKADVDDDVLLLLRQVKIGTAIQTVYLIVLEFCRFYNESIDILKSIVFSILMMSLLAPDKKQ